MVVSPKKLCPGGCMRIVEAGTGRCPECKAAGDKARGSRSKRGYDARWYRDYQKPYIRSHPLCEECELKGLVVPAACVDHVIPHEGREELLYNARNLRSLCWPCHSRKTIAETRAKRSGVPLTQPQIKPRDDEPLHYA